MCLYNLQKAYDSVEYPVLLQRLFDGGINGKLWRLVKDWYSGSRCMVKTNGSYSGDYNVERGVKQLGLGTFSCALSDSDGSSIEEIRRVRFWIILV